MTKYKYLAAPGGHLTYNQAVLYIYRFTANVAYSQRTDLN